MRSLSLSLSLSYIKVFTADASSVWVNLVEQIGNTPMHYLCENTALSLPMLQAIMDAKRANVTISNSVGPPRPISPSNDSATA
jgi:hypothetical protein